MKKYTEKTGCRKAPVFSDELMKSQIESPVWCKGQSASISICRIMKHVITYMDRILMQRFR